MTYAERVVPKGVAGALLLLSLASGLGAQERPEPVFELHRVPDTAAWTLEIRIPSGWAL